MTSKPIPQSGSGDDEETGGVFRQESSRTFEQMNFWSDSNFGLEDSMQRLEERLEDTVNGKLQKLRAEVSQLQERVKDLEVDADDESNYPRDSYSFLALPEPHGSSSKTALFWASGVLVFVFQIVLLALLVSSVLDPHNGDIFETDNAQSDQNNGATPASFIPTDAKVIVKATQAMALLVYLLIPDSSMQDTIKAIRLLPNTKNWWCGDKKSREREEAYYHEHYMLISCILRLIQGIVASISAFLLIMASGTVLDIILNFAALGFVSDLDDTFFALTETGMFGSWLEEQATYIKTKELPASCKRNSWFSSWKIVFVVFGVGFSGTLAGVRYTQNLTDAWRTTTLRVQFQEPGFDSYSGCFRINSDFIHERPTYNSDNQGIMSTSFGYCRANRKFVFFKNTSETPVSDPCHAQEMGLELAQSPRTDAFDISTLFEETWASPDTTPIRMYFFGKGTEEKDLHCDLFLNDGVCDGPFNTVGQQYDGGDCCAATCNGSNCGANGLTSVFGSSNIFGTGFHNCTDPDMVPVTIRLNDIKSSRSVEFNDYVGAKVKPWGPKKDTKTEIDWRTVRPVETYLNLDCDEKPVLTIYIEDAMVDKSETVMVNDGANCTLVVRNTDDPTWFINYTLFHGSGKDAVEILTRHSKQAERIQFNRIPSCFFEKLGDHLDAALMYTASGPSRQAVDWLVQDAGGKIECDNNFIERYALAVLDFTVNGMAKFISQERQCIWEFITCDQGAVTSIDLREWNIGSVFGGDIVETMALFHNLKTIRLGECKTSNYARGFVFFPRQSTHHCIFVFTFHRSFRK
jgi:hypothetical protein